MKRFRNVDNNCENSYGRPGFCCWFRFELKENSYIELRWRRPGRAASAIHFIKIKYFHFKCVHRKRNAHEPIPFDVNARTCDVWNERKWSSLSIARCLYLIEMRKKVCGQIMKALWLAHCVPITDYNRFHAVCMPYFFIFFCIIPHPTAPLPSDIRLKLTVHVSHCFDIV